jgi:hypothetical protein
LTDLTCPSHRFSEVHHQPHACSSVHRSWCREMSLIVKFFVMTPLSFLSWLFFIQVVLFCFY